MGRDLGGCLFTVVQINTLNCYPPPRLSAPRHPITRKKNPNEIIIMLNSGKKPIPRSFIGHTSYLLLYLNSFMRVFPRNFIAFNFFPAAIQRQDIYYPGAGSKSQFSNNLRAVEWVESGWGRVLVFLTHMYTCVSKITRKALLKFLTRFYKR